MYYIHFFGHLWYLRFYASLRFLSEYACLPNAKRETALRRSPLPRKNSLKGRFNQRRHSNPPLARPTSQLPKHP
jgi:hypothetical protein